MMNVNYLGIVSAVLAFVLFFFTYGLARRFSVKRRTFMGLVSLVLAIPGASFAAYYTHLFPDQEWYYQFRSFTGTELMVVLVGVAGAIVAAVLPRALLVLPLFGVAAFSIAPFAKPLFGPIPAEMFREQWIDGICLQSTPSTCGAAAVATILKSLGQDATEVELATEAYSYVRGTEAWYLARSVRARGLAASFVFTDGFSSDAPFPALVGVQLAGSGHFIPILKREGDLYLIGDPLQRREWLSEEQLLERYVFTGFYMPISG